LLKACFENLKGKENNRIQDITISPFSLLEDDLRVK